ncbi:hypothetical protein JTE90_022944 [Oedothorax gibbosus]|uniref:Uncharacterized protein n=1 Tax=Oedothorax gibbosus TaxID=931172 RepID=A0AAV6U866_9ARAC|nr:hypothetical protein JTE90_022944 [Oedothorax gibbosus]
MTLPSKFGGLPTPRSDVARSRVTQWGPVSLGWALLIGGRDFWPLTVSTPEDDITRSGRGQRYVGLVSPID